MVEQAAERRLAQDGPNAFSFCNGVLYLHGSLSWVATGLLFFVPECVVCSVVIHSGFYFSFDLGHFLGLSASALAPFAWKRRWRRFDGSREVHAATEWKKCSLR